MDKKSMCAPIIVMYLILLKAIHFNKQLMQCFLCVAFPLFSSGPDCIYFVDKYDARSLWRIGTK